MGYAALARLWLFESTKSRCARCSGGGGGVGREEMIRLGFIWEWGFCVWAGRVSAYHLVEICLFGWIGWVWYAISTGKNKIGKRCLSNNLSVCLAVMFLYTSRSNNL